MLKQWRLALSALLVALAVAGAVYGVYYFEPEQQQADQAAKNTSEKEAVDILASERVAYYTKVLAIFTGVTAGFGVLQLWFLTRADQTARISAEAARRTAETADRTLTLTVRPNVGPSAVHLNEMPLPPRISFELVNTGAGPGVVKQVRCDAQIGGQRNTLTLSHRSVWSPIATEPLQLEAGDPPYGPIEFDNPLFDEQHMPQIARGALALSVHITVEATDLFGMVMRRVETWNYDHSVSGFRPAGIHPQRN